MLNSGLLESDVQIIVKNKKTISHYRNLIDIFKENYALFTKEADIFPNGNILKGKGRKSLFSVLLKENSFDLKINYSNSELDLIFLPTEKINSKRKASNFASEIQGNFTS